MSAPSTENIKSYYDEHIIGKLRGFVQENPRIEKAWETIWEYAPANVTRILEIGCGIGDICWRMSQIWPQAQVTGLDISPKSIETARNLFGSNQVTFVEGILDKHTLQGKFDLIVLMDVYEHIAATDRPQLHEAIATLLSEQGRVIMSFPTPRYLSYLRKYVPGGIQPVDEDINVHVISQMAKDTGTEALIYKEVNIWHVGDYSHAVLAKPQVDWTPQSYKEGAAQLGGGLQLKRAFRKIIRSNPVFSKKTQRIAYIHKKLGKDAYPEK